MTDKCPLCNISPKDIISSSRDFFIANAKNKKGHRERIMVVSSRHVTYVPSWLEGHAVDWLIKVGRSVFAYSPKIVILSPMYGSVQNHWHYVATDLDPKADDFEQILKTYWLRHVENI